MSKPSKRKQELDKQRTEWRKKHRTLNGRVILYPEKLPEHINARGSKEYNWFWKNILLEVETQSIPAIISSIKAKIKGETDTSKIRIYRTMIGMAEDAYQLRKLQDIKDYDSELMLGKKPVYNSEDGVVYKDGKIFTTDYNEDESKILLRDMEGIIIDAFSSDIKESEKQRKMVRNDVYKNWSYMEGK